MIDVSNEAHLVQVALQQMAWSIEAAVTAPHVLMRPRIFPDGNAWCALLGADLMVGVVGFGASPAAACEAFDTAWQKGSTDAG
jgi:hypothetical protein